MELKIKPKNQETDNALLKEVQETGRLSIDVTKEMRRRLKIMAATRDVTINEIVVKLIQEELERAGY